MGTAKTQIQSYITYDPLAPLVPISSLPGFTGPELNGIVTKITNLSSTQTLMQGHTDLLSGVDQTIGGATANVRTLMSVGTGSVALDHTLNQVVGNPCGKLLGLFGSLFITPDQMKEMTQYFQDIVGTMQRLEATAAQIQSRIDAYKTQLENLIANDRAFFNNLLNDLAFSSLSQMLGSVINDPCGGYLLKNAIGTKNLLNIVS